MIHQLLFGQVANAGFCRDWYKDVTNENLADSKLWQSVVCIVIMGDDEVRVSRPVHAKWSQYTINFKSIGVERGRVGHRCVYLLLFGTGRRTLGGVPRVWLEPYLFSTPAGSWASTSS